MQMNDLFKEARADSEVMISTLDIAELLKENQEEIDQSALEGKTLRHFIEETYSVLLENGVREEDLPTMCEKLKDYRYMDRVCDLRPGRHVRWINLENGNLTKGGNLVKVEVFQDKLTLLCRNFRYFNRCALNKSILFQKFTMEEQLYLLLQG